MRDRIMEAALECLREHGVRGTTTKSVAARAGVAEGSIYNHFANRSELIAETFGLATQGIRRHADGLAHLVGKNTVEQNLVSLIEEAIEFLRDIAPIAGSLLGDAEIRARFTGGTISVEDGRPLTPLTGVEELAAYLEREHEHGRLDARESWVGCASMLIGACMSYVYAELFSPAGIAALLPKGENSARGYANAVVRSFLDS